MNTVLIVVVLAGAGLLLARFARSIFKPGSGGEADGSAPADGSAKGAEDAPAQDEELGPFADIMSAMLPSYIRPGHGFLVLRDRVIDRLELDGLDVGDPDARHPDFDGGFRGYFNVPPGRHTVVAHWQGKSSTWEIDVEPNCAYVRRMDWDQGGWVEDDPETAKRYEDLARSGSMLQAKALRPWPRPSLYFVSPPKLLAINGRIFPFEGKFGGLVNLPPGDVKLATSTHSAGCTLPAESMQVVDFASGAPEFVDPRLGAMLVRAHLRRAPREALVSYEKLVAQPKAEEALRAVQSSLEAMQSALSGAPVRTFVDEDLHAYERAFEQYRERSSDGLPAYVEALRAHYVVDSAMAEQAPYFGRYAERVAAHVKAAPELTDTEALTYLRYLAEDLQDTGVDALELRGRTLGQLLPPK